MKDFPEFMRNPANKIDPKSHYTSDTEGYVFDGADKSQMAFWTYKQNAKSEEHTHEYDEYIAVIKGQYTVTVGEDKIPLNPGDEYMIPKGVLHKGEAIAGTRAIYAFGGKRVKRETQKQ